MSARPHRPVTPAAYLAGERRATAKTTIYWNGAISYGWGWVRNHNLVTANLIISLRGLAGGYVAARAVYIRLTCA